MVGHTQSVFVILLTVEHLYSGSGDSSIIKWDISTAKILTTFIGTLSACNGRTYEICFCTVTT
jgi:hypothetical protein